MRWWSKMTSEEALAIRDQAALLLQHMNDDLRNTATRNEWMRISILAAEAERLVETIDALSV